MLAAATSGGAVCALQTGMDEMNLMMPKPPKGKKKGDGNMPTSSRMSTCLCCNPCHVSRVPDQLPMAHCFGRRGQVSSGSKASLA